MTIIHAFDIIKGMKSIILINCYFGKLPSYFSYYLKTVEANPTINFLLVTDDRTEYDYPSNFKVIYKDFPSFKDELQTLFDFKISCDRFYKLCDYKPCFGKLFYDEVKNYDFWGYADIDLVWGDIRHFMTEEVLSAGYDKIQTAGHFTIMPVTEESLNFYTQETENGLSYKKVFTSEENFAFDEWPGMATKYTRLGKKIYNEVNDFSDLSYKTSYFLPSEEVYRRLCCPKIYHSHNTVFYFNKGKLFNVSIENGKVRLKQTTYVHFQKRKVTAKSTATDEFVILPPGKIIDEIPDFTEKYLKKHAKERKFNFAYIKLRWKNLLKKLKKK